MYLIGYIKDKSRKKENMLYSGVADRQKEAGKLATRAVELLGKYDSHKVQVNFSTVLTYGFWYGLKFWI